MKSLTYSLLCLTIVATIISCSSKSSSEEGDGDEWKEMEEFHAVMADVFHPLKDSGNLEPIRSRAEDLAAVAAKWADTKYPEKVNEEVMRSKLTVLKAETRELADQVKAQAADSTISSHLTELHDLFHEVQEAWYHKEESHQH